LLLFNFNCIAEERALVAKKGSSTCVLAMRLQRHLDAKGKPFTVTIAKCSEAPSGLLSGIQQPNVQTDKYCRVTLKNTGDMELAKFAHQTRQVFQPAAAGKGKGKGFEVAPRKGGQGWQQNPQPQAFPPLMFPPFQQFPQFQPAQAAPAPKAMPNPSAGVFPAAAAASSDAPASSAAPAPAPAPAAAPADDDPWQEDEEEDDEWQGWGQQQGGQRGWGDWQQRDQKGWGHQQGGQQGWGQHQQGWGRHQ
jgi:hypothetical protein